MITSVQPGKSLSVILNKFEKSSTFKNLNMIVIHPKCSTQYRVNNQPSYSIDYNFIVIIKS